MVLRLLQREVRWIVFPGIEDVCAAMSDMDGVASGEIEVVFNGGGSKHRVDYGGGMAGEAFGFAADGSPAEDYLVRDGENAASETAFETEYCVLDFWTQLVAGRHVR